MLNLRHFSAERLQKHISNFWKEEAFEGLSAKDCRFFAEQWKEVADAFLTQEGDTLKFALCMALHDVFKVQEKKLCTK